MNSRSPHLPGVPEDEQHIQEVHSEQQHRRTVTKLKDETPNKSLAIQKIYKEK
jgi:hypothetical protein